MKLKEKNFFLVLFRRLSSHLHHSNLVTKKNTWSDQYVKLELQFILFLFLHTIEVNILQTCLLSDYEINSAHYVNIHVPPCYIIKKLHDSIVKNMPEVTINSMRIMGGFSS